MYVSLRTLRAFTGHLRWRCGVSVLPHSNQKISAGLKNRIIPSFVNSTKQVTLASIVASALLDVYLLIEIKATKTHPCLPAKSRPSLLRGTSIRLHTFNLTPYLLISCSQGGAGNALALEFAARGLRVFATARSLGSMSNLSENGIETLALDVSVSESIAALKEEISKRTGGTLDYLYNNAGTSRSREAQCGGSRHCVLLFYLNKY